MSEQEPDINAAILAELKSMNENLAVIRSAAEQFMVRERNRAIDAQDTLEMIESAMKTIPRFP